MPTMRAAILVSAGEIRITEVPVPEPGPGEVCVRIEGCGVCASNLGPWAGPEWMQYPQPPGALGHEGWGVVEQLGEGVRDLKPGQRVTMLSTHSFAEYDVAAAKAIAPLPDSLDGKVFPGEPIGCAINVFNRSDIRPGDVVAIIGIGFLGALLTKLATDRGARVIAISRRQSSLDLALRQGAVAVIRMDDHARIIEEVRRLTDGKTCDRVIEAVGKQWPLDLAGELVREGGRLVIAGYHQDGPRQVNMQMWNWKGLDVINAHERDADVAMAGLHDAVEMVSSGVLDVEPLCTNYYKLEDLANALNATRDKPGKFVKALVML